MAAKREIPIMHCFDDNYVIPAAVSFYSMLENANESNFYRLFVLHSDITVQNQTKLRTLVRSFGNADLEFINMEHRFDDIWSTMPNTDHLAKEVLYKLVAPIVFPQYDKLIITDVDVVFLGDIAPSYDAFDADSDIYFAGVRQINPDKTFLRPYYENYKRLFSETEYQQIKLCGGYLVSNLRKQREDEMADVFVSYLRSNTDRLLQAEQDVLNFCCRDKQICQLPLNYVVCSYMYDLCDKADICASDPYYTYKEMKNAMEEPVQLHYATKTKPWNTPNSTKAEIWFEYLNRTEFFSDYAAKNAQGGSAATKISDKQLFFTPPENSAVKASVLICSYNHKDLIGQALESVLNQKTSYFYEIIVADDASTDGTQDIIRSYQKKYPEKLKKCILRTKNVGIGHNYYDALMRVEGEYLAICDGDDFWKDEYKLQKQIDFLESHREYTVVCSDFLIHNVGENSEKDVQFGLGQYLKKSCGEKKIYTLKDLIYHRFIASCTVMMRWQLAGHVPEFLKEYRVIDFPLELIHASCGGIKVFEETMAVYNVHDSSISNKSQDRVRNDCTMLLKEVNQFLGYRINGLTQEYLHVLKTYMKSALSNETIPADVDKSEKQDVSNAVAMGGSTEYRSNYERIKRVYTLCVPRIVQRGMRLLWKGIFVCYKEIIPLGIRNWISPRIRKYREHLI